MPPQNDNFEIDASLRLDWDKVRWYLQIEGWSDKTLAEKCDVSTETIRLSKKGRYTPATVRKMATAFGVKPLDLLSEKSNPSTLAAVPDFTGRVKELADIAVHLQSGTAVCITAIKAAGGMGKTQLARKSSEELASQFSGGTLLLELDGLTNPKSPIAAMKELIQKCIPGTGQLPDTVELLREPYLAALEAKKLLLVLDNAADAGQVSPLLRDLPKTVSVIITSSKLISLPEVKRIDLEVMWGRSRTSFNNAARPTRHCVSAARKNSPSSNDSAMCGRRY